MLPESLSPGVLVTQVLTEETAIQQRCQQLSSEKPAPVLDAALGEQLALARHLSWQRFLKAVQMKPGACPKIDDVKRSGCSAKLAQHLKSIMAVPDADARKKFLFFAAGIATSVGYDSKVTADIEDQALLRKQEAQLAVEDVVLALKNVPTAFVLALDLSKALVSRIVYLSAGLEVYANDLAKNVPVAPGAASLVLRELAGEAAAASTHYVVDALENRHLVSKAGVSASACTLYRSGHPYGMVTTKVLKRLILRQAAPSAAEEKKDGRVALCMVLDRTSDKKPCEMLLGGAGIQRSTLIPTWKPVPPEQVPTDNDPVVISFVERSPAHLNQQATSDEQQLEQQALDFVGAADVACPPDQRCDPTTVSVIASYANTVAPERESPTTPPPPPPQILSAEGQSLLDAIGGTRTELLSEVSKLQLQFGTGIDPVLAERVLGVERKLDLIQSKLDDAVNTIGFCSSRKEKLVRARYRLIDALTQNDDVCEDRSDAPFSIGNGEVFMDKAKACDSDVYDSFEFSISEQADSCMQEATDAAIEQLQVFLTEVVNQFKLRSKPAKLLTVEVLGSADQRAIASVSCDQKFPEGNPQLALARAQWAEQRILQGLSEDILERVQIAAKAGPKPKDFCYQRTEACYAHNRRTRFVVKFDSRLLERWCRQDSTIQPAPR